MTPKEKHPHDDLVDKDGQLHRKPSAFRNFISSDPASPFPAEKDRYVLYIQIGCPWAHRTNITRSLKGLQDIVQLVELDDNEQGKGWCFSGKPRFEKDPLYGFKYLSELYKKSEPGYEGRYLVPTLWDKKTEKIVSNESSEIIRMFYSEFDAFLPEKLRETAKGTDGLFPEQLRADIDAMNVWVYDDLSKHHHLVAYNGVYKTGFATTQSAYEEHLYPVFKALDRLEEHLGQPGHSPFLFGENITEADIRLYPTILRFDVAYFTIFKCNLKMIRYNYPRLHAWLRRLYWDKGAKTNGGAFGKTASFQAYREGYTRAIGRTVVPVGPLPDILPLDEA